MGRVKNYYWDRIERMREDEDLFNNDQAPHPGTYPNYPGAKGAITSHLAADAIAPKAGTLRHRCMEQITAAGEPGLTADQIAARLDKSILSIRPRVAELNKQGIIKDSGRTRTNASGKQAVVWIRTKP